MKIALFSTIDPAAAVASPAAERVLDGKPEATVKTYFDSSDERVSVGTWCCSPGRWRVQYDETEYCRILEGEGTIISDDGTQIEIRGGDEFVVPAGFSGEWHVTVIMTKRYVTCLSTPASAGC